MNGKRMALTGAGIVAAAGIAIGAASLASASGTPTATNGYAGVGYGLDGQGGYGPQGGMPGRMGGQGQSGTMDPSKPMRPDEQLLTGDVAAQVTAAARAKEPSASVERVETDSEGVYEAHMVRTDGTHVIVQVDKSYAVTGVQEMGQGGPGGMGPRGDGNAPGGTGSNGTPGGGYGSSSTPSAPSTPSSTA